MGAAVSGRSSGFVDHVIRLMERVEHRIARTEEEREAAYRLRYEAYQRNGLLKTDTGGQLYDPLYDDAPHAWIATTFVDGELAGTLRISLGVGKDAEFASFHVFPDTIGPRVLSGQVIVEYTRLAARLAVSACHPELPYILMRPGYMALDHFRADLALFTPRIEHVAFYRRVFGARVWCPSRDYPGLTGKFSCVAFDFQAMQKSIESRYPFFKSSPAEREALFGPRSVVLGKLPVHSSKGRVIQASTESEYAKLT